MKAQPAHFALLAALLAGFSAQAATVHVTFNDSLTNTIDEARWEYRDVMRAKEGEYYFNKASSTIESIEYAFAITSVVVEAKTTSVALDSRQLLIDAVDSKLHVETQFARPSTSNQVEKLRFEFDFASAVKSFKLSATSGKSGYIYLNSAEISGCYICPQPQNVEAGNVQGTRFTLSWEKGGEGAVSNRVDMLEVRSVPEQGDLADRYDFEDNAFNGGAQVKPFTPSKNTDYLCFTNSVKLYVPGGTNGVLQISTRDDPGALVYDGPGTVGDITLFLRAAKHSGDSTQSSRKVSLLWTADGIETNSFPDVEIANVFKTVRIPLTNMVDSARLVMKPESSKGDQRIWIDEITFVRDYAEAYVATNALPPMATDQNRLRIRRLAPKTLYIATVTAFDEEGNPSEPSAPVEVETRSCDPDTILLLR